MHGLTIVGYAYAADLYTPRGVVEALIGEGRLSPAARDMEASDALEQLAEAEALDELERNNTNTFPFPVFAMDEESNEYGQDSDGSYVRLIDA